VSSLLAQIRDNRHNASVPAYLRSTLDTFCATTDEEVLTRLTQGYLRDGFAALQSEADTAFEVSIPRIRRSLQEAVSKVATVERAGVVLKFPIYRLRKRLDLVLLIGDIVVPIEIKTRAEKVTASDHA